MVENIYDKFSKILHGELLTALGCTEPICIAYCSAKMKEVLGTIPESVIVECSGDILKNVKGAIVPNSGGLKGVKAAAILGAIGGDSSKQLEVLSDITEEHIKKTKELINQNYCQVKLLETNENLHVKVTGMADGNKVMTELMHTHTQIVRIVRNDKVWFEMNPKDNTSHNTSSLLYKDLTVKNIIQFSENVDLDYFGLREVLEKQIELNLAIANEGLFKPYGACIGQILTKNNGDNNNVETLAKAYASAGADARMSGCVMPVVINSGSGNQGITVSLPVIKYAEELGKPRDKLLRALIISNLIAIYIKSTYGRLSAFCGVVGAAAGCGAAITWLYDRSYEQICGTIINTLANISGMICDGAKPSCAAKIASAIDAAILGHKMSMQEKQFMKGDGVVKHDVEATIQGIGNIAREGMWETDKKILELMLES